MRQFLYYVRRFTTLSIWCIFLFMNTKTQELTFGAMIVAVFGVLLLLNRQTGGMFEGFFMFIFPIPMVAFSADRDMNRTLILVMILSAAIELLCTVALATFAGFDLNADIMAMQESMNTMLAQAGVDTSTGILSFDYLRRMYIITTGFVGAMEGLIVYYLSYAILKKLRYPIRKPQPLTNYYPSRISGVIALVLVFVYAYTIAKPFSNAAVQNVLQSAGMCGVIYLIFFGYIALLMVCSVYLHLPRILGMIISLFLTMSISYIPMLAGYLYISGNLHRALDDRMSEKPQNMSK